METRAHLLVTLNLAKYHGCWPFVPRISVLTNILIRMLATAEVVAVEIARVVVVIARLMAWLGMTTRVHQRALYHLAVITAISQSTSSLKIIGLLHHYPLLHSRLQPPQEHVPSYNIVQSFYPQLQLKLAESCDVLRNAALLAQVKDFWPQLHVSVNIGKLGSQSLKKHIDRYLVKNAQIIPTKTTPPCQCIVLQKTNHETTCSTAFAKGHTVKVLAHGKKEIFKFPFISVKGWWWLQFDGFGHKCGVLPSLLWCCLIDSTCWRH